MWKVLLIISMMVGGAVSASNDDEPFASNLFSDLAPILALFGEELVKQFMSESMGWLDHIIFGMGPLGILTAVVGAIRVAGPPWLKWAIGRGRESRLAVEVELLSSTSDSISEVWNGEMVERVVGYGDVQQLVYFGSEVYTVETAEAKRLLEWKLKDDPLKLQLESIYVSICSTFSLIYRALMSLFRRRHGNCLDEGLQRDAPLDIEITDYPWPNAPHKFKTNMSLNLYPHSKIEDLYAAAACGIIIQFGVLAFSGLTVYYPIWNLKFQKKGQPVQSHAYPLMATGTCLLVIGMIMCSAVVDHCTMEEEWVISSSIRDQKQKAHILWLQRGQSVSGQYFASWVIFAPGSRNTILRSLRIGEDHFKGITPFAGQWIHRKIAFSQSEAFTLLAILFSLVGFILQLQGLQGLHWSTSVSQIIAVFLMTAVRGWVRRGSSLPVAERVLDGCEMDWLALNLDTDDVATYFDRIRGDWEPRNRQLQDRTVAANSYNLAHSGDLRMATATDMGQTAGEQPDWETKVQQRVLRHRQRLGKLTNWVGPASKPALSVAGAIEAIMNTLIPRTGAEFSWYLQFEMETEMSKSQNETESRNGTLDRTIKFTVGNMEQGGWAIDASEIEAALSLWIYSNKQRDRLRELMGENSDTTIKGTLKGGWLEYEKWKTQSIRVLGPNTEHLNRDLKRWIRNIDLDKSTNPRNLVVGFIGLRSRVPVRSRTPSLNIRSDLPSEHRTPSLRVISELPLELVLAQHMFSAFMWAIAEHIPQDMISGSETTGPDGHETSPSPKRDDTVIHRLAAALQRVELARTPDEALMCIIPPLSYVDKLPHISDPIA